MNIKLNIHKYKTKYFNLYKKFIIFENAYISII